MGKQNKNRKSRDVEIIYGKNACFGCIQGYLDGVRNRDIVAIYILQTKFEEFYKIIPVNLRPLVQQCNAHDMFVVTHEIDKHQGIAVKVSRFKFTLLETMLSMINNKQECRTDKPLTSSIFLLDRVQDPQNVGNIIRSAYCFGVDGVVLTEHDSCGITSSVVRASAGYSERILISSVDNVVVALKKMKEIGYWVIGFDVNVTTSANLTEIIAKYDKCVFIFGSEGSGMKDLTKKHCDLIIKLSMVPSAESLNVANTAAIVGWEIMKRKSPSW